MHRPCIRCYTNPAVQSSVASSIPSVNRCAARPPCQSTSIRPVITNEAGHPRRSLPGKPGSSRDRPGPRSSRPPTVRRVPRVLSSDRSAVDLPVSRKLITPGTQIQHQWFRSSKRAHEKVPFEFPEKSRILALLQAIETARDPFCYGAIQSVEEIRRVFTLFQELRAVFRTLGVTPDEG